MQLAGFGSLYNKLYTDKLTVRRHTSGLNDDGTTNSQVDLEPIHNDVACRISFTGGDNPETNLEDANPVYLQTKLFCSPSYAIKKGDELFVERLGDNGEVLATYKGTASMPLVYPTHQEVLFAEVGDA